MASLTNCEFMVKGYHYTEPTDPIRTDSCRLYLDVETDSYETQTISQEQMRTETLPYNTSFTYILKNRPKIGTTIYFNYEVGSEPGDFSVVAGTPVSQNDSFGVTHYDYDGNLTITITAIDSVFIPEDFVVWQYTADRIIESNTTDYTWIVPSTAYLDVSNKAEEIRANLVPNSTNLVWTLTLNQYIDTSAMAYITLPGSNASVGGRFLSHDWYYEPTGTAVENITYTIATRELVMTLSNWSNDYTPPTIRYVVGDGFRIHLKGIHGFYVQT